MAQNELNRLFPNKVDLNDISKELKSVGNKKIGTRFNLPVTLGAGALASFEGAQDVRRYLKSFGEYAEQSLKNTGRSLSNLDANELNRIRRDFNSLYFSNPKNIGPTSRVLQAIVSIPASSKAPGFNNTLSGAGSQTKPNGTTKPPIKPSKKEPKKTAVTNKPNFYDFDPATGLPILPEEAVGLNTNSYGSTQPSQQSQAAGSPQQTKQAGRTVDDIIALAQAQQQLRNEQMAPYMEALQEAMEKYGEGRNKNFFRDLGLAGLTGLTGNQAYSRMIGGYDDNQVLDKRLSLQQQLANLRQQQLFDPTPIYGNAELVQRMGLAPEAALASPDFLKQYANIYNYGLDYNAVLARLKQQEQQNALDRQLKWNIHMNPQYNTLASQAQLGSSLLSSMQASPALRKSMTPEMIQYLISLTGYKPGSTPVPAQNPVQEQSEDDIIDYNASLRGR